MNYSVTEDSVNSERYIEFLGDLIHGREHPLILTPISTKENRSTFFATREAHEYWKTSGRFCNHGIV
jgi:hypothetical protein